MSTVVSSAESLVPRAVVGDVKGAAESRSRALSRHGGAVVQLGLLLAVAHLYRVEESFGFLRITPVVLAGFAVHGLLPRRWRLPFFVALGWAAILVVFHLRAGALLVAIGLGLIGLCHLPVPFRLRVALVAGAGLALAGVRAGWWLDHPVLSTLILPILGSMFMFRLILYLYDLRNETEPAPVAQRLAYFFLLPNVCFPLFPVVDWRTYRRTYYDDESWRIVQKGLLWISRGILHLLLYRLVYHHLLPVPSDVAGLGSVVGWMVTTYLLYLRISGQFHLIIGILCLFGFNLPETHHLYFLASSFNDFWRRINIYWKDFMMKIFYYPVLMRLRGLGMEPALVIATLVVFAGTWILHSYQWFWLQGSFPIRATDGIFWGVLGVAVSVNSLREVRKGRKRTLRREAWTPRSALARSARTLATFVVICVLWSFWSSDSPGEWLSVVSAAAASGPVAYLLLLTGLAAILGIGTLALWLSERTGSRRAAGPTVEAGSGPRLPERRRPALPGSPALRTSALTLVLLVVGWPGLEDRWPPVTGAVIASLRADRLNDRDAELQDRGYYEGLLDDGGYASALWRVRPRPEGWEGIRGSDLIRHTGDVSEYELLPSYAGTFKGSPFNTNRWGLRDREYSLVPGPDTRRFALLGASYEFGAGVLANETFEALLEERLNREGSGIARTAAGVGASPVSPRYEILNFAVGGYSLLHNVVVAERKVPAFRPELVLVAIHSTEEVRLMTHLQKLVRAGVEVPYPAVRALLDDAGVSADMPERELERRLEPTLEPILGWALDEIASACRRAGVRAVAIYVPTTEEVAGLDAKKSAMLARLADAAELPVLSLQGAYDGHDPVELQLAPWDFHPSALGHRLLAERLHRLLTEADLLALPAS